MYESQDDSSVFTVDNLEAMCNFEKGFMNFEMEAKKSTSIATTVGCPQNVHAPR